MVVYSSWGVEILPTLYGLQVFAKDRDEQREDAFFWCMMFLVIAGVTAVTVATQAYAFGVSGERLTLRLRDMVFRAYLKQVR